MKLVFFGSISCWWISKKKKKSTLEFFRCLTCSAEEGSLCITRSCFLNLTSEIRKLVKTMLIIPQRTVEGIMCSFSVELWQEQGGTQDEDSSCMHYWISGRISCWCSSVHPSLADTKGHLFPNRSRQGEAWFRWRLAGLVGPPGWNRLARLATQP